MKIVDKVSVILTVGLIAEGLIVPGYNVYAAPSLTFRIKEENITMSDEDAPSLETAEAEAIFMIDTAEDLRLAFQEQSFDLNEVFFLNINASLGLSQAIQERDMGFLHCQWITQRPVDGNGNITDAEYVLHMFTVEYRDDIKALQAYRNRELIDRLTAREAVMLERAESIIANVITHGMSDYDKVLAIHDYIVLNGRYSTRSDDPLIQESIHRTEGILLNGVGVCSSYSGTMCLLLGMVDVECIFVTGIGQNKNGLTGLHSWNKVMIDGMWYNFDVTWDDPTPDNPGVVSYAYFGITDEIFSTDHIWNNDVYPAANGIYYNYYRYNGLFSHNYEQFRDIITQEIEVYGDSLEMQVSLYVENYDSNEYDFNFIFDLLPDIESASHTRLNDSSGEFTIIIKRTGN